MTRIDVHKKAMIEALIKNLGIVTSACKQCDISRQTHYNWYNDDPEYKQAVDDIADVALDFAESMLHKQIQDRDTTATIFYLKTKGKRRGYVERSEFDHSGAVTTKIDITVDSNETAEELRRLIGGSKAD